MTALDYATQEAGRRSLLRATAARIEEDVEWRLLRSLLHDTAYELATAAVAVAN